MEKRLITGNDAVALAALRAGVKVVTGYPGTPSTGALASLLQMDLPGRHIEWSVNEKVALEIAAGAAWAGQRALCTMKMSGVNVAYDSLCSIAYSGTSGGLVIYVADDPGASAGMVEQDSRAFAAMTDLPMLEPSTVAEAYTLTQAAFELSELTQAPVFVRLVAGIANAYAAVAVEDPLPPEPRPPVLSRDITRFTKAGAVIAMDQHRETIKRLELAGQIVRQMGLNRLQLAPRAPVHPGRGSISIVETKAQPYSEPNGWSAGDLLSPQANELLVQTQQTLRLAQQLLPDWVQDALQRAQEALRDAQLLPVRQSQEVLRQVQAVLEQTGEALSKAQEALPYRLHTLDYALELLRQLQQLLPQTRPAGRPPAIDDQAAAPAPAHPVDHPLRREGLGIIAAGIAGAYVEEGIRLVAALGPESWAGFGPANVSLLQVACVNPLPEVEIQALLRHCSAVVVLEELEPHVEKFVLLQARAQDFEGRIIGKTDGFFSRIGEYGVAQVARGLASALDIHLPAEVLHGSNDAEKLAAARPITVCAGCPHRGTFLAINAALRKLRYGPNEVMVTGDIGCTILGMNPPFNTVWNEVAMGASIPLAQGYVHAGVQTPVIATIGDSTFFHGGIPGLINAVQHQVPLTLIIMDNGWTAMTGMQVNPGTNRSCEGTGGHRIDIAQLVPALGVEQFFRMDPFDLQGATATLMQALKLPGVKVVLSRQECAIQAMRRGERAGAVQVVAEKCNLCKLCISVSGCPAISINGDTVAIDPVLCYGCGLCADICKRDAILKVEAVA